MTLALRGPMALKNTASACKVESNPNYMTYLRQGLIALLDYEVLLCYYIQILGKARIL